MNKRMIENQHFEFLTWCVGYWTIDISILNKQITAKYSNATLKVMIENSSVQVNTG